MEYSYVFPYEGNALSYRQPLLQGAEVYQVLVPERLAPLRAGMLDEVEPVRIQGTVYQAWERRNIDMAALTAGLLVIRSMARQGARAAVNEVAMDDDLTPYLEMIDRDLGFGDAGVPGQPENRQPPDDVAGVEPVSGTESELATGDTESPEQDVK